MNQLVMIILCLLLPFVAVLIKHGLGKDFLINILLCILGYIPGVIHALWLITKK
ncbi:YqaE/Pmp3 family membrane protein [Alteromonas flava]|uniref:YqaE/Pmp3 family membrane protein n=1 Tax=Alteromonas flava TaxID=2048003 RepID=UPI000C286156|nr:YqaE/Pmp3 family membrane protein [Alteromonas flava]